MKKTNRLPELELNEAQLDCLISPLRKQLLSEFLREGPASVADIAEKMSKPPKSLYYQVRLMAACGLLLPAGTRGEGKREEALFDAPASKILMLPDGSPEQMQKLRESVKSSLRLALREYEQSETDENENLLVRVSARLNKTDYAEFERKIDDIVNFLKEREDDETGTRTSVTIFAVRHLS